MSRGSPEKRISRIQIGIRQRRQELVHMLREPGVHHHLPSAATDPGKWGCSQFEVKGWEPGAWMWEGGDGDLCSRRDGILPSSTFLSHLGPPTIGGTPQTGEAELCSVQWFRCWSRPESLHRRPQKWHLSPTAGLPYPCQVDTIIHLKKKVNTWNSRCMTQQHRWWINEKTSIKSWT